LKIGVYSITKNEEKFIDRMINSCIEADSIVICDTGSTDNTYQMALGWAEKYPDKIKVLQVYVSPWRFDIPRNASLAAVPPDIDACICLDLDEILTPGWRPLFERDWEPNTTRFRYKYIWSWDGEGNPGTSYYGDKIHLRTNYRWVHPVHEVLYNYGIDEVQTFTKENSFEIHHFPDHTKSRGQYFHLLEMSVKEDPTSDRNSYYLGREYFYHKHWQKAIDELERHRSLPTARWNLERSSSYRISGKCLAELGRFDEAEQAFLAGIAEADVREAHVDLANFYHDRGEWQKCYDTTHKALTINEPIHMTYITDNSVFGAKCHDLLTLAAWNLGLKDEAIEQCKIALNFEPNNQRFKDNLAIMERLYNSVSV